MLGVLLERVLDLTSLNQLCATRLYCTGISVLILVRSSSALSEFDLLRPPIFIFAVNIYTNMTNLFSTLTDMSQNLYQLLRSEVRAKVRTGF